MTFKFDVLISLYLENSVEFQVLEIMLLKHHSSSHVYIGGVQMFPIPEYYDKHPCLYLGVFVS